jgi:hypothetical protein
MRAVVAICSFAAVLMSMGPAGPASAAPPAAPAAPEASQGALARQHHAAGSRLYDLAEYEAALREFKEAYRVVADPAFLFNIAQCHRKLGNTKDAITFYRTYLRRAPQAVNRGEVERRIAELERAQSEAAAATVPGSEATPGQSTVPGGSPALAAAPSAPAPVPPQTTLIGGQPGRSTAGDTAARPFYSRTAFWVVAGVVLAGVATATIIISRGDSATGPFCPDCAATTAIDP